MAYVKLENAGELPTDIPMTETHPQPPSDMSKSGNTQTTSSDAQTKPTKQTMKPANELPSALSNGSSNHLSPFCGFLCTILVMLSLAVVIPMLVFYVPDKIWNDGALQANCTITDSWITRNFMSYDPEYDGSITVNYVTIYNTSYSKNFQLYYSAKEIDVREGLANEYPVDSIRKCFYQARNPADVKLELLPVTAFLIVIIACFTILGSICILLCAYCFLIPALTRLFMRCH